MSKKNLRTWIQTFKQQQYVKTASIGQLVPIHAMWLRDARDLTNELDILYLLGGKGRKFYELPSEESRSFLVHNQDDILKIPFGEKKVHLTNIMVTEIKNGFAKIYTQSGADGAPQFAGWIEIFNNRQLTVWPIITSGC